MPRHGSPYGPAYVAERATLLGRPCQLRLVCVGAPADSADHYPPLSLHVHIAGSGCCVLRPACRRCQTEQSHRLNRGRRRGARLPRPSRQW